VEDLKTLFLFEIMAMCPFYSMCRDEENDTFDADCKTNEYLGKGCYKGLVQIAYILEGSTLLDILEINTSVNPFNN